MIQAAKKNHNFLLKHVEATHYEGSIKSYSKQDTFSGCSSFSGHQSRLLSFTHRIHIYLSLSHTSLSNSRRGGKEEHWDLSTTHYNRIISYSRTHQSYQRTHISTMERIIRGIMRYRHTTREQMVKEFVQVKNNPHVSEYSLFHFSLELYFNCV